MSSRLLVAIECTGTTDLLRILTEAGLLCKAQETRSGIYRIVYPWGETLMLERPRARLFAKAMVIGAVYSNNETIKSLILP